MWPPGSVAARRRWIRRIPRTRRASTATLRRRSAHSATTTTTASTTATTSLPQLVLLSLSDSFASMWPTLADECGLTLHAIEAAAGFDRQTSAVGVVAAGGAEEMLESALRDTAGATGTIDIAAVGALPDHRLASSVVRAGAATYFALPEDVDALRSWLRDRADALRSRIKRSAFVASE